MKKTLLIAAAALAASVISSQAQVYSQNIVGYANVSQAGGSDALLTVPFKVGVSNGINEVFGSTLPIASQVLTWNGVGYDTAVYDPTDPNGDGSGPWFKADGSTPITSLPLLSVGKGFHLIANGAVTNTFVGTVAINVGTSNVMTLSGGTFLVAPVVPYAGAITNGNNSSGGPNINGLPIASQLLFWTGGGYNTAVYDPTDPNGDGSGPWFKADGSTVYVDPTTGGTVPTIKVGQGFFIVPNGSFTWTTGL